MVKYYVYVLLVPVLNNEMVLIIDIETSGYVPLPEILKHTQKQDTQYELDTLSPKHTCTY